LNGILKSSLFITKADTFINTWVIVRLIVVVVVRAGDNVGTAGDKVGATDG
jgi:hypothetical protein